MKRILRLLVLSSCMVLMKEPAQAQSMYTWVLDPDDAITYREWAKKEWEINVKDLAHVAAKATKHASDGSEVPTIDNTRVPTDAPGGFWDYHVPQWVKRWTVNPFSKEKSGNQAALSKLWEGMTAYQRARASLRTLALMKASIAGMRFEINAWRMMQAIDVSNYEQTISDNGLQLNTTPLGIASLGIVPRGKEDWRKVVEYLHDDPQWDEGRDRIKWKGPRSLSDVTIAAEESLFESAGDMKTDLETFLESVDRGTRAVGQGLAEIRSMVNRRAAQAVMDADSPRRLQEKLMQFRERRNVAYSSMVQLRAMIEARPAGDIAAEYAGLVEAELDDIQKAYATAEASAHFYQQLSNEADNVVALLDSPRRLADLKKLEDTYATWMVKVNDQELAAAVDEFAKYIGQLWPSLIPYYGAVKLPVDYYSMITGMDLDEAGEDADEGSDTRAMMRDAQARIFALRFGYYLWEELRAWRKLTYLMEQVDVAEKGITYDMGDSEVFGAAFDVAILRQVAFNQLRIIGDQLEAWKAGTP